MSAECDWLYSFGKSSPISGSAPDRPPSRRAPSRAERDAPVCRASSEISLRAAIEIALIMLPFSPSTIFRWLSRSTNMVCSMRTEPSASSFHEFGLDRRLIRQFVVQLEKQFFARHLGGDHAVATGPRARLPDRATAPAATASGEVVAQIRDPVALDRRDHEGALERRELVGLRDQRQQLSRASPGRSC